MLPVPTTAQPSIFDFGGTSALIEDAYLSSTAWLSASEFELAVMSVTVVTDSAASLPAGASEDLGIVVVPMTLVLGGVVYADGDLSPEELVSAPPVRKSPRLRRARGTS